MSVIIWSVMNGKRLRELRLSKRTDDGRPWSLAYLSRLSGVDSRTISDIEHSRNLNPAYDKVVGLAHALGVEPQELWPVEFPRAVNA
jgi:transcriptional regulator with XRE-family HTH domain